MVRSNWGKAPSWQALFDEAHNLKEKMRLMTSHFYRALLGLYKYMELNNLRLKYLTR